MYESVNSWLIHVLRVGYFDVIDCYCIFGLIYCAWCFGIGYVIFPLCLFSLVLQSFVSFGFGYDLLCL